MSHHHPNLLLALLLLVAAVWGRARSGWHDLAVGALAAAVTLTRTNYAVPAALVLLAIVVRTSGGERVRSVIDVAIGGVSVLALVLLPYAVTGTLGNLRYGIVDTLFGPWGRAAGALSLVTAPGWLWPLVLLQAGLMLLGRRRRIGGRDRGPDGESNAVGLGLLPGLTYLGMVVSLALHDSIWDHYSGMLMVPLAVTAGLACVPYGGRAGARGPSSAGRPVGVTVGAIAVLAGLALTWTGSAGVVPSSDVTVRVAVEDDVVAHLDAVVERRPGAVWTLQHHYVLWRLGLPPALPEYIHPSTITLQTFRSGAVLFRPGPVPRTTWEAVGAALDSGPRYLVSSPGLDEGYLVEALTPAEHAAFVDRVVRDYDLTWVSDDGRVAIRTCRSCP